MKLANATAAPIANVIAASWNAGIFPVATVMTDSSDHIRIAVSPIERSGAGGHELLAVTESFRHGRACPGHPRLSLPGSKDVDARHKAGHDDFLDRIEQRSATNADHTMYWPPLIVMVEPVMPPASSAARNTTARAISSGSPRRLTGISGRMLFSSTSFGTACTISVLM